MAGLLVRDCGINRVMEKDITIGIIGQGFIGSAYADDFEERGYSVVRYAQDEKYKNNKEKISECDVVFIAVPTPTTPEGFDVSIVQEVLKLVGKGNIAVIKSTIIPGGTDALQEEYPHLRIMHSPEFLRAATAAKDAKSPDRNIVGVTEISKDAAELVLSLLPKAPYSKVVSVREAEMVKYMGNVFLAQKVIFANLMYDMAKELGVEYDTVQNIVGSDPRITHSHLQIAHDGGRGAGGFCFIKDLAAFSQRYREVVPKDVLGAEILRTLEEKNRELLETSKKDLDLLEGVYGTQ